MTADTPQVGTRPLLDILVEKVGQPLTDGYDAWAFRSVNPDFTSSHGFRWPFPGGVAEAAGPLLQHRGSCPAAVGDGICVATTVQGMASGGITAGGPVLLTAHRAADVIGDSEPGKLRVRAALVVEVVWLRSADLRYADLRYANLRSADLRYADLRSANLQSADLRYANLRYADLQSANLRSADLQFADLRSANLQSAYGCDCGCTKLPDGWKVAELGLIVRADS
jgi:hypothetical protein